MALAVKFEERSIKISVQSTITLQLGYSRLNFTGIVRMRSDFVGQCIKNFRCVAIAGIPLFINSETFVQDT